MADVNYFQPNDIHLDTKVLRYIIEIVDQKNLSRAAEELYLSQPALSRHLRNVESLLGTPIFYRQHNKLKLTNEGKIFINGARSIVHIEQEMLKNLNNTKQDRENNVYAAAEGVFYDYIKEMLKPLFAQKFPNITLCLTKADGHDVRRLVSEGFCDVGFYFGSLETESPFMACETLFNTSLVFCAPADFPISISFEPNADELSTLQEENFLLSDDVFLQNLQFYALKEIGIRQPHVSCIANVKILLALIQNGYGNVLIPEELFPPQCDPARKFVLNQQTEFSGIFVSNKRHIHSKPTHQFAELAKNALKKYPYAVI